MTFNVPDHEAVGYTNITRPQDTTVLGVIPARGGSRRVPRKNLKKLGGKPLVVWTIEAAKKSALLNYFLVSTNDAEIARISREHGAEVPFTRPEEISVDCDSTEVSLHALKWYEREKKETVDYVCLLQPTSPFRTPHDIDACIQIAKNTKADSVISVTKVQQHPYWCLSNKSPYDNELTPFLEVRLEGGNLVSQNLPLVWYPNGAVYVTRRDVVLEGRTFGKHILPYCLTGDSYVYTRAKPRPISEIKKGDVVLSWRDGDLLECPVSEVISSGRKAIFAIKTRTHTLKCSAEHPLLVVRRIGEIGQVGKNTKNMFAYSWVRADNLTTDDYVVTSFLMPTSNEKPKFSASMMYLLGIYLGDGCIIHTQHSLALDLSLPSFGRKAYIREKCAQILAETSSNKICEIDKYHIRLNDAKLCRTILAQGFGRIGREKLIPNWVFEQPPSLIRPLIEGIIDSDGSKPHPHLNTYTVKMANKRLISELKLLAEKVGYRANNIHVERPHKAMRKDGVQIQSSEAYSVQISKFAKPRVSDSGYLTGVKRFFGTPSSFQYEKIRKITNIGEAETFNIEVQNSHNFIADGFVVHNCMPRERSIDLEEELDFVIASAIMPILAKKEPTPQISWAIE